MISVSITFLPAIEVLPQVAILSHWLEQKGSIWRLIPFCTGLFPQIDACAPHKHILMETFRMEGFKSVRLVGVESFRLMRRRGERAFHITRP